MAAAADPLVGYYRTNDVKLVDTAADGFVSPVAYFKDGRSIFSIACVADSQHLREMKDDYGLLPMPMYDTAQETYDAGVQDSHNNTAVTSGNKDYEMISAVLEMFAHKSYSMVRPNLFERVLKGKLRDEQSAAIFEMLDRSVQYAIPNSQDNRERMEDYTELLSEFDIESAAKLKQSIDLFFHLYWMEKKLMKASPQVCKCNAPVSQFVAVCAELLPWQNKYHTAEQKRLCAVLEGVSE